MKWDADRSSQLSIRENHLRQNDEQVSYTRSLTIKTYFQNKYNSLNAAYCWVDSRTV